MAMNAPFDWRRFDRRLFAAAAVMFPVIVVVGFARTYYLKPYFGGPPLPGLLVHLHGIVMTLWVGFFIAQVWLIRTKNHRRHMNIGIVGIILASLMIVIGFLTAIAAARYGSNSTPGGVDPLRFLVVPFADIVLFAIFFGGAMIYRRSPADHKRLMLLTVVNFLPPAIARFPIASLQSLGPLVFFGLPAILTIFLLILDTWKNGKLNKIFPSGAVILILSYPLRLMLMGTDAWLTFALWLTGLMP
jgi:uncharacterized membrane protein YozB (DUF420 family)